MGTEGTALSRWARSHLGREAGGLLHPWRLLAVCPAHCDQRWGLEHLEGPPACGSQAGERSLGGNGRGAERAVPRQVPARSRAPGTISWEL